MTLTQTLCGLFAAGALLGCQNSGSVGAGSSATPATERPSPSSSATEEQRAGASSATEGMRGRCPIEVSAESAVDGNDVVLTGRVTLTGPAPCRFDPNLYFEVVDDAGDKLWRGGANGTEVQWLLTADEPVLELPATWSNWCGTARRANLIFGVTLYDLRTTVPIQAPNCVDASRPSRLELELGASPS